MDHAQVSIESHYKKGESGGIVVQDHTDYTS